MTHEIETLVARFYAEIWNAHDHAAAPDILAPDFRFRGSLGPEKSGIAGFLDYVDQVHAALGDYTCFIDDLITTEGRAAAKMTFRGIHRAEFFGVAPTGTRIEWPGAAFFRSENGVLTQLWVLGDVDAVKTQLGAEAGAAI